MRLVLADTHLDDNPNNNYRWTVFDSIREVISNYPVKEVHVLGDFVDKRDRHSGRLVNQLVDSVVKLAEKVTFVVLRGNHDTPLNGPAFWEFFNTSSPDLHYITRPTPWSDKLLLLPFTPNPVADWKGLKIGSYEALFMHVTYPGALAENGYALEGSKLPILPRRAKIYSGDVHTPQCINNFVHVGAPHPIKFGDDYRCRMLLLDENTFDIVKEIELAPPRKLMLDIRSIADLITVNVRAGDQVKIRISCDPSTIDNVDVNPELMQWAQAHGVTIAGTEVILNNVYNSNVDTRQTPQAILEQFAASKGLSEEVTAMGLALLREVS